MMQARKVGDSTEGKLKYQTSPITLSNQRGTFVTFTVDNTWGIGSIGWVSVMYEKVDSLMACPTTIGLTKSTETYTAKCDQNRVAEIAVFVRDPSFVGLPDITAQIPPSCMTQPPPGAAPTSYAMYFFTIPCDPLDETFCVEATMCPDPESDLGRVAKDNVDDGVSKTTNVVAVGSVHSESFESPSDIRSWTNGVESRDAQGGKFLGRFGKENPIVTKTFVMPATAESATIKFVFLDINNRRDKFEIGIQGSFMTVDLSKNTVSSTHSNAQVAGNAQPANRIQYSSTSQGKVFEMSVTIPKTWWNKHNNELPVAFKVTTTLSVEQDAFGIDDFSITAVGKTRRLDDESPENEPSEEGDDGTFYCKAVDYPCGEGADMVYVCHYSTRLGYQTFCIPEADSEVLRFYNNDYCGPCVGGFGGINDQ